MKPEIMTDLALIAQWAAERRDDFEVLRYMLQDDDDLVDERLDARIEAIAAPIIAAIDCTQCANCCRTLDVYLTPDDTERLAAGLGLPTVSFEQQYVTHGAAADVGEWGQFSARPCAFLAGQRCAVYALRPETCRLYPQLTPDFRWVLDDLIQGAAGCPIIYHVLAAVDAQSDDLIKNP